MSVRSCIHPSRDAATVWPVMAEELVTALAGRGVLGCTGLQAALLDAGHAIVEDQESGRT